MTYAELSKIADDALATYEAADQAMLDAVGRGASRAERLELRAKADAANDAHCAACDARDAAAPVTQS